MKIPPAKPFIPEVEEILEDMRKVMQSGMLTMSTYTKKFEEEFAKYSGTEFAIAVNSGTAALEMSLRCFGLNATDEVIVPTNTFIATPSSVLSAGGKPILSDIDPETLCLDSKNVLKNITNKTKGVIAVHVGGLICPEIKAIRKICDDHGLFLIEDCAHAHGSKLGGKLAGSFGNIGCFSFYPTKVMTCGEGGMIITQDKENAEKCRILRDQGKSSVNSNEVIERGGSWRLSELHAVLGFYQLKHLERFIKRREEIAKEYDSAINKLNNIESLKIPQEARSSYYKYIVFLKNNVNKEQIASELKEKYGVSLSGEVYWPPCHLQPLYKKLFDYKESMLPQAEVVLKEHTCLPLYVNMTDEEVAHVINAIKEVIG